MTAMRVTLLGSLSSTVRSFSRRYAFNLCFFASTWSM